MSDTSATLPAEMLAPVAPSTMKELQDDKKGMADADKAAKAALEEKNTALQKESDQIGKDVEADKKFDATNPFPKPDIKPWTAKPPANDPVKSFGSWASTLGILAGAITKTGLASSLNASAAAMNAFRQNDMAAYAEAKEAWKENTKIATEQAEWEAKAYQHGWDLMKTNQAAGISQLKIAAEQADNKQLMAMLDKGQFKEAFDLTMGIKKFANDAQEHVMKMTEYANKVEEHKAQSDLYVEWTKNHPDALPEEKSRMRTAMMSPTSAIMTAAQTKWEVLHDSKTGIDYRYNPISGEATKMDGSPYTPQSASRIQGGSARSGIAMALGKYLEENPNATAQDVSKFNAEFGAQRKALGDFSPGGASGKQVNALNTATDHLETLRDLAGALKNSDMRTFNKVANAWGTEFGETAPTNFDTAKQLIGAEVVKTFAQTGGGVTDREEVKNAFDKASTPKQLDEAIDTAYRLMGGKMKSLQRDYETTTKETDFGERLSPQAKKAMGYVEGKGGDADNGPNHPPLPPGVPETAQWSPSQKKFWWQENSEWKSKDAQ